MAYEDDIDQEGLRERLGARGEAALGELAQALLENPVFNQALSAAFGAREVALGAQRSAMGALNLPSAAELDRLERRLRSVSDRLEALEGQVDQVADDLVAARREAADREQVASEQAPLSVPDEA